MVITVAVADLLNVMFEGDVTVVPALAQLVVVQLELGVVGELPPVASTEA